MEFPDKFDTYINQIFGDYDIRNICTETCPNHRNKYRLDIETLYWLYNGEDIARENGEHHYVTNLITGEKICSIKNRLQNVRIDKNDCLCQSYSLAVYFYINLNKYDKKEKQMQLIKMYRTILNDIIFIEYLRIFIDFPIFKPNWKIYKDNRPTRKCIEMNSDNLLKCIKDTLDDWEKFGYQYFINDGIY
jgi:hypothetical protein